MPEVRYTLTEFQTQALQDYFRAQASAGEELKRLQERANAIRVDLAKRNEVVFQGLAAQLGTTIPTEGVRFDRDEDGERFVLAWEDPAAAKAKVEDEGEPKKKKKAAKKATTRKRRTRKKAS